MKNSPILRLYLIFKQIFLYKSLKKLRMEAISTKPKFVVIFSVIPMGAKEDRLFDIFSKMLAQYSPDASYKMICNQDIRTRAEEEFCEMYGLEDTDPERDPEYKSEFKNFKKEMTTTIFQEEYNRVIEHNKEPGTKQKIKVHFILFSKHCPLNHLNNNLNLISLAFPKGGFYKVALTQARAAGLADDKVPVSKGNDPLTSPYSYSTRFKTFQFPFSFHSMICSLYSSLAKVRKKTTAKRLQTVMDRTKSFKGVLFNFTRDTYTQKCFSQKGFDLVLDFQFFDEKNLEVQNYKEVKYKMDKLFKINERKYCEAFETAANDLIDCLNENIVMVDGKTWKIQDVEEGEEVDDFKEFVLNWEGKDTQTLIDNAVFNPMKEKFGFRDIREELDATGN